MHRAALTTKNDPIQNVKSAEVERPCSRATFSLLPWTLVVTIEVAKLKEEGKHPDKPRSAQGGSRRA